MDIEINEVQEIIKNLEGSGELSIKEEKYLNVAKLCVQLAAENSFLMHRIEWPKQQCPTTGDVTDVEPADFITATYRIVAGIKADAITASLDACSEYLETDCVMDRLDISYEEAEKRTSGAIEFHDAMVDFANQLREGDDK